MSVISISEEDAVALTERDESQFWDHKSKSSNGAVIQKIAVALANAEGGEFIVGIEDAESGNGIDRWEGFERQEDANFIAEALIRDVDPPVAYEIDVLEIEGLEDLGLAMLVRIEKSIHVHFTSGKKCFVRGIASSEPITGQQVTDLQLAKGSKSYEDQLLSEYHLEELETEAELGHLLSTLSPSTGPAEFLRRERLVDRASGAARVAGAVLFAENPSAIIPRRCGIKISRYGTTGEPRRENLSGSPVSVEGPARAMIEEALRQTVTILNGVMVLQPDGSLAPMSYPPETLKEILVNAVIHRDYNMPDDVQVMIFDNRVEIKSPGGLPGRMTLELLFVERASRNSKILRLLNKYPSPLNQDIGEGLRTAREKMLEARLKEPTFEVQGNYFIVTLPHERLARPEEIVLEYLQSNEEITNRIGRDLTGIRSENSMKEVFYHLRDVGRLELVPNKRGNKAAWRLTENQTK
ncbi:ATP-binding protein [Leucobacter manosquensis]|uniref:DNA binding domain-containing protein n=1 Tax=Leucobacter manosquensis TaxID=2810611 RepID=A0ABS5M7X4_9MICO|nr:ATP-binding protein [Leucobacter manosquensis]MBS3183289.1 putative DNA binding domain-containing protein [Leucobacter manosquensis]